MQILMILELSSDSTGRIGLRRMEHPKKQSLGQYRQALRLRTQDKLAKTALAGPIKPETAAGLEL